MNTVNAFAVGDVNNLLTHEFHWDSFSMNYVCLTALGARKMSTLNMLASISMYRHEIPPRAL